MILDIIQEHDIQAVLERRSTREQTERVLDYFLTNPAEASWVVELVRERLAREARLAA